MCEFCPMDGGRCNVCDAQPRRLSCVCIPDDPKQGSWVWAVMQGDDVIRYGEAECYELGIRFARRARRSLEDKAAGLVVELVGGEG